MLVAFLEDLKISAMVARAVFDFGIMIDLHEMENVAKVVVKVYLNDDAKILDSINVNAGIPSDRKILDCSSLRPKETQCARVDG